MFCVICSAGGHLTEALLAVSETKAARYFVTKEDDHVGDRLKGQRVYYVTDPHISILGYIRNAFQSIDIYLREKPGVIVTTGAGIAIPTCIIGKLFGSKIIFIETGARVTSRSKTGKLLYRIANITYVQWPALQTQYPKSIYLGRLG